MIDLIKGILRILFGKKTLESALNQTRTFKIRGIFFRIKRIDPLDYLAGSKAFVKMFDTYQVNKEQDLSSADLKRMKEHFKDVFLAAVVEPKLARKEGEEGFLADKLFVNWELCNELYQKIMIFTYGKKNFQLPD